jgi:hypothetical protein
LPFIQLEIFINKFHPTAIDIHFRPDSTNRLALYPVQKTTLPHPL